MNVQVSEDSDIENTPVKSPFGGLLGSISPRWNK